MYNPFDVLDKIVKEWEEQNGGRPAQFFTDDKLNISYWSPARVTISAELINEAKECIKNRTSTNETQA